MPNAKTVQFLTQDEMKRLFAAIESKRDYALFLIAYRHGLRASEMGMLQVHDIDLKRFTIQISRLKGSDEGVHPMRPDEVKAVKAMLKARDVLSPTLFLSRLSQPISRRMLDVLMKNYATEAGIFAGFCLALFGLPQKLWLFHELFRQGFFNFSGQVQ